MSQSRSLEVKVGLLILVGLGLLTMLVLVMGGISLGRRFHVYVDFENPGGIQPGAPVKMAGVRIGTIDEMEFRASAPDPTTGRRTLVRARISIEEKYRREIHRNAEFYVTTQGVLGEQFIAVEPGTGAEIIQPGVTVVGQGPPRIDLFVARAYTLLDDAVSSIQANRETLRGIVTDLGGVLRESHQILARNSTRVDSMLADTQQTLRDADGLITSTRARYVDGPQARRILDRAENLLASAEREVPPLARDARALVAQLQHISGAVGDEQIADVRAAIHDVRTLTQRANVIAADAQRVTEQVRQGHGTVGALLMDEEIYDDLQELLRDLKHNPWKFFWRE